MYILAVGYLLSSCKSIVSNVFHSNNSHTIMIKWDAIIFFHDRVILQITRSEKVVNTFQQCANSIVLEPITQYNNLNVETRSAKGHHSGDRSQAVSRPSSRQSRCNRRIIESARSLRTHTTFIIALISSFSFFPSPSYPSPPSPPSLSIFLRISLFF